MLRSIFRFIRKELLTKDTKEEKDTKRNKGFVRYLCVFL